MTAMNLVVRPKRKIAYLISDCAHTMPDGTVDRIGGKIMAFARIPCAIGITGNVRLDALGQAYEEIGARNVGRVVRELPRAMRRAIDLTAAAHEATPRDHLVATVRIAAYSHREKRPVGYVMATSGALAQTMGLPDTWKPYEATSAPSYDIPLDELLGRPCEIEDETTFDPDRDALALIAAQRARPQVTIMPGIDQAASYRIGGEAQLTEVTKHGVRVHLVGTFPDRVGERINPQD